MKFKLFIIGLLFTSVNSFCQTKTKYYCTPCNASCDTIAHDSPGICHACNMPIIALTDEVLALSIANAGVSIPKPLDLNYNNREELGSSPYRASRLWITDYSRTYVRIKSGDIFLSGALYLPKIEEGKKVPAIILAHGSGPTTQYNLGYYIYLGLKIGAAVLVADKRGVGNSEGVYDASVMNSEKVFAELASDLVAQLKWIKTQSEINVTKIGMMGPSQAGWIMPIAAKMDNSFNFIISLSGPAVSVGEENYFSTLTNENEEPAGISIAEADKRLKDFKGDHIYAPSAVLEKLSTPILWQFGTHDRSVPVDESIRRLRSLNKPNFEIVIVPNVGHGSTNVHTGEYEDFVKILKSWLVKMGVFQD
jgi:uncharacterized protein